MRYVVGFVFGLSMACAGPPADGDGVRGGLAVSVAPFTLPGVEDACYALEVWNASELVWSQSEICADRYGDLATDIAYVAPCDASGPASGAPATVVLRIDGLYSGGEEIHDFIDPCAPPHADGCRVATTCRHNADTPVSFSLTLMRRANQGFFDIAVSFEDIFCSAKVDCTSALDQPLRLVHHPVSGERVESVVWALSCTDGESGDAKATHLYMSDVVLDCGPVDYDIDPSGGPGNLYPLGVAPTGPIVQAMVFEGVQAVGDVVYWNVALGLDRAFFTATTPDCTLRIRATASSGALTGGVTPPNTNYPYVAVNVPINDGAAIVCDQHPIGSPEVAVAYTGPTADGTGFATTDFRYVATRLGGVVASAPVGAPPTPTDYCGLGLDDCAEHAACANTASAWSCTCLPGYHGDGRTCDPSIVSVSAGKDHTCGLRSDGTLVCWGGNSSGEVAAPGGTYTAVVAGNRSTCALTTGGAIACWGAANSGLTTPPAGTGFTSIGIGSQHGCALGAGGVITCWGNDADGKTTPPAGSYTALGVGGLHACALDEAGVIQCWGEDQLDVLAAPTGGGFTRLAVGYYHNCAVDAEGAIVCWGDNGFGQSEPPAGLVDVTGIALGVHHSCAVHGGGAATCWGSAQYGQDVPPASSGVAAIVAGYFLNCVTQLDGAILCAGENLRGGALPPRQVPFEAASVGSTHACLLREDGSIDCFGDAGIFARLTVPPGLYSAVATGNGHACGLRLDGTVACWGGNQQGQTASPGGTYVAVASGGNFSCALAADGTVACWGDNFSGQSTPPTGVMFRALAAGGDHVCGIRTDGAIACWGWGASGQLVAPAGDDFRSIAAGANHTCALDGLGKITCWGANASNQTAAPGGPGFVQLALGGTHTCALEGDGDVTCWGANGQGQGTPPAATTFESISGKGNNTCGVRSDGATVCWGVTKALVLP